MTNAEKKRILSDYSAIDASARAHMEEYAAWMERLFWLDESGNSGELREKIADLNARILTELGELSSRREMTEKAVKSLPEERLKTVISRKYLQNQSLERVAEELNYSWRHVLRLHDKALSALEF